MRRSAVLAAITSVAGLFLTTVSGRAAECDCDGGRVADSCNLAPPPVGFELRMSIPGRDAIGGYRAGDVDGNGDNELVAHSVNSIDVFSFSGDTVEVTQSIQTPRTSLLIVFELIDIGALFGDNLSSGLEILRNEGGRGFAES